MSNKIVITMDVIKIERIIHEIFKQLYKLKCFEAQVMKNKRNAGALHLPVSVVLNLARRLYLSE